MPKATVNEHSQAMLWQHEIRFARQTGMGEAEAQAQSVGDATNTPFWGRVGASHLRHEGASFGGAECIHVPASRIWVVRLAFANRSQTDLAIEPSAPKLHSVRVVAVPHPVTKPVMSLSGSRGMAQPLKDEVGWATARMPEIAKSTLKPEAGAGVLVPIVPVEHEQLVASRLVLNYGRVRPAGELPLPIEEISLQAILVGCSILSLVPGDEEPNRFGTL